MRHALLLTLALAAGSCGANAVEQPTAARLTIDQLIDIKHPSNPVWSPDGRQVVFLWDRAGVSNLYLAEVARPGSPRALTAYPAGAPAGAFWSADSQRVYFARGGDLWQVAASGGTPTAVWTTSTPETNISPSPDAADQFFGVNLRAGASATH